LTIFSKYSWKIMHNCNIYALFIFILSFITLYINVKFI
jgi:hypothetical protein